MTTITADQFLAQVDRTLVEIDQSRISPHDIAKIRECFLGAYYVLTTHERTISAMHDRLKALEERVARVFRAHGLQEPPAQQRTRDSRSAATIVTGRGGAEGE